MALPKIQHPTYEVYLKSLDKNVRFRPFLVKEEKILLMAKESNDAKEITSSIIQILNNCCLDDVNIAELPLFDIEMFFVNLRAKSVGETAKLNFNCQQITNEQPCNTNTEYNLDLTKIRYETTEGHSDKIDLGNGVGMRFKYPRMDLLDFLTDEEYDVITDVIVKNIDYIYDPETVYKASEISREEILSFLDDLNIDQLDAIRSFFSSSPKVVLEDKITCKKCGYVHNVKTEELLSFFI